MLNTKTAGLIILTIALTMVCFAADEPSHPCADPAAESSAKPIPLSKTMAKIGGALSKYRRGARGADATNTQLADLAAAISASIKPAAMAQPEYLEKLATVEFQLKVTQLRANALELEIAHLRGDKAKAAQLIKCILETRNEGHQAFKPQ